MMKIIAATFLLSFIVISSFAQEQKKFSTYLSAQYNKTIYDVSKGNNPWGTGLGIQVILNNKIKFKPTIELTGDIYLENDKVLRINSDGSKINDVRGMVNLFAGTSFNPTQTIYLSFSGGPSFISGQTHLGIKSSIGFYFSKSQKWTGRFSYINIFNRDEINKEDFGSLSLSIGLKLF